jgi:hypothetical protein
MGMLSILQNRGGRRYQFLRTKRAQPVEFARNLLVQEFLKTDCDRLWFLDADMLPAPPFSARILDIEGDIVGAAVPIIRSNQIITNTFLRNDNSPSGVGTAIPTDPTVTMIEGVDAVGTGCMVIKRKVLEDSRMRLPGEYRDQKGKKQHLGKDDAPPIFRFRRKPNGAPLSGEDVDFCLRAKKLGYSVTADYNMDFGHLHLHDIRVIVKVLEKQKPWLSQEQK